MIVVKWKENITAITIIKLIKENSIDLDRNSKNPNRNEKVKLKKKKA